MNEVDTFDACLQSLQRDKIARTRDYSTAQRAAFSGVSRGFMATIETDEQNLPRTFIVQWEQIERTPDEDNVVMLRPGHVPLHQPDAGVQTSTGPSSAEPTTDSEAATCAPRRSVQPVPVEMARSGWFPRSLVGFAAGAFAAVLFTSLSPLHGWPVFLAGFTLPLIGASLGAATWHAK